MPNPYGSTLSPGAWLEFLQPQADEQAYAVQAPMDYYNGLHKLAFATAKFREAFSRYFPPMANNWMKLVVDAPVSRLNLEGFRFDPDPSKPGWDQGADQDAWSIWQSNNMDGIAQQVHTEAIKCGVCNVLVSPSDGKHPLLTAEHPSQSYVQCSYIDRRQRLAAIKRWVDEIDEYGYAYVYLPDYVYRYRSVEKVKGYDISQVQWTSSRIGDDPVLNNPLGVVPMIPVENAPDMLYGGRSDLEVAMPIQDAVNKFCLDMQVSSEYHAFPQRWASGWETAYDADGNPIPGDQVEIKLSQSRIVRAESIETKFGSFTQGDVQNYIHPIELYVDHLAAVTQTPAYYLKGKMANLSADALRAADAGLADRVRHKILAFSDGWEEAMRVAFTAQGDTKRGKAESVEAMWKSPETISLAQTVDAAVKMRQNLSAPIEMCWEMLGWSQQQILQAKDMMGLPVSPAAANEALRQQQLQLSQPQAPADGGGTRATANSNQPPPRKSPAGVVLPR
jgi:hypothetical protein